MKALAPTLDDAILLAVRTHQGVHDKFGKPFILHPLRVMLRLEAETERMVGVLHDVVEDSAGHTNQVTLEDLRRLGYSAEVVSALDCVTKRNDENYEAFIARTATNPIARRVKLADLADNMDLKRIPQPLTARDQARLEKYRKAVAALTANQP